jgi:hypothetical protein
MADDSIPTDPDVQEALDRGVTRLNQTDPLFKVYRGWLAQAGTTSKAKSRSADPLRVYLTEELDEYVEFDRADYINSRRSGDESLHWVRRDAPVRYGRASSDKEFLEGPVERAARRRGGSFEAPGGPEPTRCRRDCPTS